MNKNQTSSTSYNKQNSNNSGISSSCSFDLNSIKNIGESIGILNLSDDACRELASDITFTLKSLLLVVDFPSVHLRYYILKFYSISQRMQKNFLVEADEIF